MYRSRNKNSPLFQSTLPVWGATRGVASAQYARHISIHAPRVGSDGPARHVLHLCASYFNPRSPCGERRCRTSCPTNAQNFNPRSPCGERRPAAAAPIVPAEISIHAPRVGSDDSCRFAVNGDKHISIHAPRVGSDQKFCRAAKIDSVFQSTLPVWGATRHFVFLAFNVDISIHAPRVGSDQAANAFRELVHVISIHAPRVGSDSIVPGNDASE